MLFFFFNDTATTEIYTLSLHDALPISASLRALPALKEGTLEALIFIFSPVWGFLPSLALRSLTENFPKPVILTSSPPLSASVTTRWKAPKCSWASLAVTPASSAILSMSSVLFMMIPFCHRLACSLAAALLMFLAPCLYGRGRRFPPPRWRRIWRNGPYWGTPRGTHNIWHKRFGGGHEVQRPRASGAGLDRKSVV